MILFSVKQNSASQFPDNSLEEVFDSSTGSEGSNWW